VFLCGSNKLNTKVNQGKLKGTQRLNINLLILNRIIPKILTGRYHTKLTLPVRYYFFIAVFLLPVTLLGQLSAPGANAIRYSSYTTGTGGRDPIFIFCNSSGTQKGALTAVSPGGTGPFTFTWLKWSDATRSFSVPVKTETGVMSSSLSGIDDGGYRVNISSSGFSTSLTGWIFLDQPHALARLQNRTCDYVALNGTASADTFIYSNPATGQQITLPDKVRFLWSSDPASSIPYPDIELNPQTFNPPLVDVTYKLAVTDSFTCVNESSFFYESIHVKADFTAEPTEGGAPLEVTFTNKSVRAETNRWEFGDDSTSTLADPPPHTYYIPGDYSVKLTVESSLHCIDSLRFDKIVVDPSSLHVPNVFTPNGDGMNDVFMVDKTSLKYFKIDIFSRTGISVYSFEGEGEMLRDWPGWDGHVNNSSFKASPGVYFYIIRAKGYDDVTYSGKLYRGFVYLYR
jgi:gliding motility-associated-like protein